MTITITVKELEHYNSDLRYWINMRETHLREELGKSLGDSTIDVSNITYEWEKTNPLPQLVSSNHS